MSRYWTKASEIKILMEIYPDKSVSWDNILKALPGRTKIAILGQAHRIGLTRRCKKYSKWTDSEVSHLKELILSGLPLKLVYNKFPSRSIRSVQSKFYEIKKISDD